MKVDQAPLLGLLLATFLVAMAARSAQAGSPARPAIGVAEAGKSDVPSFRFDVMPELVQNCAAADGCHGKQATHSVHLDLRPGAAYAQLVDRPSEVRKGAMRVRPGNVAASFIVNKIDGSLKPGEGKRMPLDEQTGMPTIPSPLSPDYVEKVLKPWILAGAPDN